jgi:hypothetical protein
MRAGLYVDREQKLEAKEIQEVTTEFIDKITHHHE